MSHLGGRRRTIIAQQIAASKEAVSVSGGPSEEIQETKEVLNVTTHKIEPKSQPVQGPKKMCPKCGKVKAYHFHVVKCKG